MGDMEGMGRCGGTGLEELSELWTACRPLLPGLDRRSILCRVAAAGGAERESNPCPSRFCKRDALPLSYSPLRGARTMVISSRFVKHGPWHKKLNVGLRRVAGYYKPIAASTSSTVVPCAITLGRPS